ncbi:MAG TPA: serine hydrolase domain-containing protein [Gemmatimonadaceae bacterium]|jgi:CubicO group peptidase (beta-lactamase class C family)|nr:serine hydrolase domain-containing protein [Gemmatimonadaceae bacterium]
MHRICRAILAASSAIAVVTVAASARGQAGAPAPIATDTLISRLSSLADSLAARDALSGVILLAKDGEPVFERAYGLADRDKKRANTVGTSFNVSSIGKRFTQVAIAQLVAAGKLNLDATIASVWPDYPNPDVARQVTIRQLLEHRSGIGGDIFANPSQSRSNRDYLALFVHEPLRFAPGTREEYSNAGYVVLGEIIARLSHEAYDAYVRRHIFAPAAMSAAGYFARDSLPPFAAIGYTHASHSSGLVSAADVQPRRGSAAGGAYASARDLLKFVRATRTSTFGVPVETRRSVIAGGSPGSNGVVAEGLPGGYDLIVLENLDPPAADAIVSPVTSWLGAASPGTEKRIAAGAPSTPVSSAPTKLPDTRAGSVVADYLRAFNSGDPAKMKQFFDTEAVNDSTRPTEARVDTYRRIYEDNGALEIAAIERATPGSITIIVHAAKGQTLSMSFELEDGATGKLKRLAVNMSR